MAGLIHIANMVEGEQRVPVMRERRNDLDRLTPEEFRQKIRLNPDTYKLLYNVVQHDIEPKTNANHAISGHTRLQATLRFLAQGNMFSTNSDAYGMSKTSMSDHIDRVLDAIVTKVRN